MVVHEIVSLTNKLIYYNFFKVLVKVKYLRLLMWKYPIYQDMYGCRARKLLTYFYSYLSECFNFYNLLLSFFVHSTLVTLRVFQGTLFGNEVLSANKVKYFNCLCFFFFFFLIV